MDSGTVPADVPDSYVDQDAASQASDDDRVDLDSYLAVLERDQLERLVVRMIVKDETNFDDLQKAVRDLNEDAVLETIENAHLAQEEAGFAEFLTTLSPCVVKAEMYAKLNLAKQALTILVNITQPVITALSEADTSDDEIKELMRMFFGRLESAWQKAIESFTPTAPAPGSPQSDTAMMQIPVNALVAPPETFEGLFSLLAEWRAEVTPRLGPMFSDPLRALKKSLLRLGRAPATAAQAAGANKAGAVTATGAKANTEDSESAVRATDASSAAEDRRGVRSAAQAVGPVSSSAKRSKRGPA